ncbi:tRNA (adenosine(37)-N6)-dimethylallyltransferase MiaA [Caulobacter segnis]|uniref:tRNA (adenosine(37)-N6)-dimethylallyltransferase MiaA n=1 Tax=Caulobacter segnis TaxID=88688 RepID=UPI00240EEC9C|nr:tRNA (adenosine(37)-N6)-dimethylallyltransferase MiaA [Caulobacter segnis]MDG2522758.1 tRNA (adenosine(37)-N6)-dimethylallyltransferase MiaA [Caulobacter segnis]
MITLIAGPTASGKSALALRLAKEAGAEIINADSMQIYDGLRVLTAGPPPEETAQAPHHLFGVVDAAQSWSVGRWLEAALETLSDIEARGRTAVVVGGTGLYFRALTQGLADVPPVPEAARDAAGQHFDTIGEAAFRELLRPLDPEAETRIESGDRQRLVRAYAVASSTGRALSDWQADTVPPISPDAWRGVVLEPDREALYARCDLRLGKMIKDGALDEVRAMEARGLDPALPALKAVGYRELAAHVRGEISLSDALAAAQMETRRYAKRQLTWFRNQTPDWIRIDAVTQNDQWGQFIARMGA